MPNENDVLVNGTVAIDGCCDQLGVCLDRVGVDVVWLELAQAATWEIDRQTWRGVDEAGEKRHKLSSRAAQTMDEDEEGDVGRQLAGLGVRVVDRPDLGVRRRLGGVRRVGGVLAEQAWVVGVLMKVSKLDIDAERMTSTNHR